MGQIDVINAKRIHGFDSKNIWAIGLPKFLPIESRDVNAVKSKKTTKILYLGFSLPHSERKFLNELNHELLKSSSIKNFEITYRPHPAQKLRSFDEDLSEQILEMTPASLNLNGGLPTLDKNYLNSLLKYDLVISTPTTLLLECILLGIPCVCDLSNDGIHRTTASLAAKKFTPLFAFFCFRSSTRSNISQRDGCSPFKAALCNLRQNQT
jgi:hypothetical protein